jgi:hypothetical protein
MINNKCILLSLIKATPFSSENPQRDADGPNGPDTEPNSMFVLLDWWSTEDNYTKYRGGKAQSGKTKE